MNGGKYNRFSYTINGELHPPHQNQDILQTMFNVVAFSMSLNDDSFGFIIPIC